MTHSIVLKNNSNDNSNRVTQSVGLKFSLFHLHVLGLSLEKLNVVGLHELFSDIKIVDCVLIRINVHCTKKMKFPIKNLFSKCDLIRNFL